MLMRCILTLGASAMFLAGCGGSDDKKDETPATTTATLSSQYTAKCASCHGQTGELAPEAGKTDKIIKGTSLSLEVFRTRVRSGVQGTTMLAIGTTDYSDANLNADFAILSQ